MTADLIREWRKRAEALEPYAPAAAAAFRQAADDLAAARDDADDAVTLKEAHAIGGYSIDHLQRLVKSGQLKNVHLRGRIKIRRSDVPMKPGHSALRAEEDQRQLSPSAVVTAAITRSTQ